MDTQEAPAFRDPLGICDPTPAQAPRRDATLDDALGELLDATAQKVAEGSRSAGTLKMQTWHAQFLGRALDGRRRLTAIDEQLVERFVRAARERGGEDHEPLSPRTVQKIVSTLRMALKLAHRRRWIERLPVFPEFVFPPAEPRASPFSSGADFWRLFRALPRRRAEWMAVCFFTIQHAADVERMTWAEVNLEAPPWMMIRRTKSRRAAFRVVMPGPLARILRERRARVRPRPTDRLVEPWPNRAIMLARAAIRVGLPPMTSTSLRHAATSAIVRRLGITPASQQWGGWSSVRMMEVVYAHALPARLKEIADELATFVDG